MVAAGQEETAEPSQSGTPVRQARYVAIITDGNGRWAQQRGLPAIAGHEAGADTVKARLRDAVQLGIRELTVYSFSTENWSRADEEVAALMDMFGRRIELETPELHAEGVRMRFLGRRTAPVAPSLVKRMEWAETLTAGNGRITLFVAFNYGGRAEILDAARTFTGTTEEEFRTHLYYLTWQTVYSEFVFRDELGPDFTREAFEQSLGEFAARQRRFGGR